MTFTRFVVSLNKNFVTSRIYPENPEGTRVIVGSMNIGYVNKILDSGLPSNLSSQLSHYHPARELRSSSSNLLAQPYSNTNFGSSLFNHLHPRFGRNCPFNKSSLHTHSRLLRAGLKLTISTNHLPRSRASPRLRLMPYSSSELAYATHPRGWGVFNQTTTTFTWWHFLTNNRFFFVSFCSTEWTHFVGSLEFKKTRLITTHFIFVFHFCADLILKLYRTLSSYFAAVEDTLRFGLSEKTNIESLWEIVENKTDCSLYAEKKII